MARFRLGLVLILLSCTVGGLLLTAAPAKWPPDLPGEGVKVEVAGQKVGPFRLDDSPLPEGAITRLGTTRFRHNSGISHLAFSPDGKTLASGGGEEVVRLWDLATCQPPRLFTGHRGGVAGLAFSPEGTTLAVTNWDPMERMVRLCDVPSGVERLRVKRGPVGPVPCSCSAPVAFSPDGKVLASTSAPGEVCLWEPASGRPIGPLGRHEDTNVLRLVFAPDGRTLASCGQDGTVRLWDVTRRKPMHLLRSRDTLVDALAFSRDGRWLLSGGEAQEGAKAPLSPAKTSKIRIWDVKTGKQVRVLTGPTLRECVFSLALAPNGRTLAVSSRGAVELWDLRRGRLLRSLPGIRNRYYQVARSLCFSPDGKLLAGGIGNAVYLWETASGRLLTPDPAEAAGGIFSVALSGDGRLLAAADEDGTAGLWDLRMGQLHRRLHGHEWTSANVAVSPDGKTIATTCDEGRVRLWDAADGRLRQTSPAGPAKDARASCPAFSPDGKLLVWGYFTLQQEILYGDVWGLRLWDAAKGRKVQDLQVGKGVPSRFSAVAFSADRRCLIATTIQGETYQWEAAGAIFGPGKISCRGSQGFISVTYSPDGTMATTGVGTEGITVWDLKTGRLQRVLGRRHGFWKILAYSPDGRYLASGAALLLGDVPNDPPLDHSLRLYEVASGQEILHWELPVGTGVGALTFAPDNHALVTGMTDSTVLVWAVFPAAGEPIGAGLWEDLAHTDARRAHRALAALVAAGDQAVALLERHLHPVRQPDAKLLARLVADLDSDVFSVREKATRELARVVEGARPSLERARAGLSPEAGRRVARLLEGFDPGGSSPEVLRSARAVAALEYIGTPRARRLLEALAQGVPEARRTQEAKATLQRLKRVTALK